MNFELRMAREKLEREQKDRKLKAKLKIERERKAREEANRQREAIEAAQRSRRIDAMEAQLKADQHMEEDLFAGRGIMFNRVLEAVPYQGIGDKIKLPPSCFTELSDQGSFDKGPLHFCLSVIHHEDLSNAEGAEDQHSRTTHAGVLEFTAEERSVGLPPHIWSNLFVTNAPKTSLIEVRYVWLAKGKYAKLQAIEFGFSDIPNHKAVLETSLRQHATLSQNDVLTVNHGAHTYHLRVLELKPSSSISVLDTDIEVDIVGPESAPEKTDQHVLIPLMFGKSESGVVDEGHYMYYKFSIDIDVWEVISSGGAEIEVKIDMEGQDGDTDLYISKHPLLFPNRHQHGWSSHDVGSKVLVLSSKDQNLAQGTYSIGVYGFKGKTKYQLSVSVQDSSNRKVGQQAAAASSTFVEADTVECRNCRHYIPSRTIALHEAYCRRHNLICQHAGCGVVLRIDDAKNHIHCKKCGLAFHGGEIEKHMKVFHEALQCPCGVMLEKEQMSGALVQKFVNLDWRSYLSFLNWMPAALKMPEPELIDHAGLDSAIYLRIYWTGLIAAFSIMVPVNWTNRTLGHSNLTYSTIDKLSISNIPIGSNRFWTHLVMSYVFTLWTCYVLKQEYEIVASMRLHFLASEQRRPDQFTVLVRNVPPDPDESVGQLVEHFFLVNHPDHYLSNQVVYNANKLSGLVDEKKKRQNWLDYYQLKYTRKQSKRPTMKTGLLGLWGKKWMQLNIIHPKLKNSLKKFLQKE